MHSQDKRRVFISHSNSSQDRALLPHLLESLTNAGLTPIVAEHTSEPMSQLGEKVRDLIESCDFFLALLTDSGQNSVWIQQELGFAFKYLQREKRIAVLV